MKLNLAAHANNTALHHTVFSLPFAYMAAFLAAEGVPPLWDWFWITVAIVGARSAALCMDNLADLRYDRLQPRHKSRALVSGRLTKREAYLSLAVYGAVFVLAVLMLKPICLKLLPVAVLPFVVYPFTKRFTSMCHIVLGAAIAMAPAGGWVAVRGSIDPELIILCLSVALWIGAFDAIYGAQDEAFDKSHGLHSLATAFTAAGALKLARFMHAVSIGGFVVLGLYMNLDLWYYAGVVVAAVTLVYQHGIVTAQDFSRVTQVYFMRNGIVSLAMFAFTWISLA